MPVLRKLGTAGAATALGWAASASAAVMLAALAAGIEIESTPIDPERGPPAARSAVQRIAPSAPERSLALYAETLARPVFEPSRRPRPVEPPPVAEAPATGQATPPAELKVVGIMKGRNGTSVARALMRAPDAPLAVWVEPGSSVGGWKVASIGDRSVVVESGGRRVELGLFDAAPVAADGK